MRRLQLVIAFAFAASASAHAAQPMEQRLCINEGATTVVATYALEGRYRPLADVIQKTIGRKVAVSAFTKVSLFEADFSGARCDYVFGKTIDVLAEGIRTAQLQPTKGYHAVVKTVDPYVAGFVVSKDFEGTGVASLVGKDVMLPPKDTFTAQLALAELRNAGLRIEERHTLDKFPTDVKDAVTVRHVPYHEAITSTVESGWYKAGAVNPTVLSAWKGRVLTTFKPQPGWVVLASASTSEKDRSAVASALAGLDKSADGKSLLKAIKVPAFVPAADAEYLAVLDYLRNAGEATASATRKALIAKSTTN
jgi:ABC-type phosphate/phosphonate transport system substrate-binding protein